MKIVIRAGGIGTRLWPMSRKARPKQFQQVADHKTMIRTTFERIAPIINPKNDLFVSVYTDFLQKITKEIPELDENKVIIETDTRNTGPAMCLEVCFLEKFVNEKEVIASLTSDDFISDNRAFRELLITGEEFLLNNPEYILTPAVKPDYPDTGYSYMKAGKNLSKKGAESIFEVADVVEKPNSEFCQDLINTGVYYCHTGMYLWRLDNIVGLFKRMQPNMYSICKNTVEETIKGNLDEAEKIYSQLEKMSIETAITDKAENIAMSVSNKVGWSDLGKWHIIKRLLSKSRKENLTKGEVRATESENNLIYSNVDKKIIVVHDINDLAVVDTEDVLFISSLKSSADVKKAVENLKQEGREEYL